MNLTRVEKRCRHGFEITVVECPVGCGGPEKRRHQDTGRADARTGFSDLTGQKFPVGGIVVARIENDRHGNSRFEVEYSCRHRAARVGGEIRKSQRTGVALRCMECRSCDSRGRAAE